MRLAVGRRASADGGATGGECAPHLQRHRQQLLQALSECRAQAAHREIVAHWQVILSRRGHRGACDGTRTARGGRWCDGRGEAAQEQIKFLKAERPRRVDVCRLETRSYLEAQSAPTRRAAEEKRGGALLELGQLRAA